MWSLLPRVKSQNRWEMMNHIAIQQQGESSTVIEEDEEPVHYDIGCDGCGSWTIRGPRYKSVRREDYDLCRDCFQKPSVNQKDYVMMEVTRTIQQEEIIHHGVICDGCSIRSIRGTRYKSVSIENFDLCPACFENFGVDPNDFVTVSYSEVSSARSSQQHEQVVLHGFGCDGCGVWITTGPRYESMRRENHNLCHPCLKEPGIDANEFKIMTAKTHANCAVNWIHRRADRAAGGAQLNKARAGDINIAQQGGDVLRLADSISRNILDVETIQEPFLPDPKSFREALNSKFAEEWRKAMKEELDTLQRRKTWEYAVLPRGKRAVGSKWVFRTKLADDGTIQRFKARLVARGFMQVEGIDYDETFAPVARLTTIRLFAALAATLGWHAEHLDFVSAYLNANLEEEVYLSVPEGLVVPARDKGKVLRLLRALYGLKQSGRKWNEHIHSWLQNLGWQQSESDPCLYTMQIGSSVVPLIIYVDDLIIGGPDFKLIADRKEELQQRYEMRDLRALNQFLGITFLRDREKGTISLSQARYVSAKLKEFGFQHIKPAATPMNPDDLKEHRNDHALDKAKIKLYQSAIGSLLHLANGTRYDIAFACHHFAQYLSRPCQSHWQGVQRIFAYLQGTKNFALTYGGDSKQAGLQLAGYSDADWAGCTETRRSVGGYAFMLGGAAVSWSSKKQGFVSLSSTESEYAAVTVAAKEALWLRKILADYRADQKSPILIHEDNKSCIDIAKDSKFHARVKHFDVEHHFIRSRVQTGEICLRHCPSEQMWADIFTKPLSKAKFVACREALGLRDRSNTEAPS